MRKLEFPANQIKVDPISIRQIQEAQYQQEAQAWLIAHVYCLQENLALKITFNHMHYNVSDIMKIYPSKKQAIINHFEQKSSDIQIDKDRFWISKINSLPDKKYQFIGSPTISPKLIIQDFYNVWGKSFYIPIDMSHLTGDACLLNYIFDMKLRFEDNWNEVKKIKKNQHNFLFEKDELGNPKWKQYINSQKAWVSIISNSGLEDKICGQRFSYDQNLLQGLVVMINQKDSRWTFSFYPEPQMMAYFISKYKLIGVDF